MRVFFGAAIQGHSKRGHRAEVYRGILSTIKALGHEVYSEHTVGESLGEALQLLDEAIGPLPDEPVERRIYVRNKMIAGIEGAIHAAIFEVSVPSLGTGIEFAHAYLRPRLGLERIPILALYENGYWPNNLSSMIRGITQESVPQLELAEYVTAGDLDQRLKGFLNSISKITQ